MDIGGHRNNIPSLRARPAGLARGGAMPVARPRQRFSRRSVQYDWWLSILLFAICAPCIAF